MGDDGWTVQLDVIGKKEDNHVFETIIRDPKTNYHEPVPKEKLIDYYRDADIFVLASISESFGLVYAEAMSQGLPVIYTKGQGFDGQFPEGRVGYHVDSNIVEDIVTKIKLIVDRYEEISKNCIKEVKRFDWASIAEQYYIIYNIIAKSDSSK